MGKEYKFSKKEFKKANVGSMYVFFDNGDYVQIQGEEILDLSIKLYDRLVLEHSGICFVAANGFMKLKLISKNDEEGVVYNPDEYKADRKKYIENRLCKDGGIRYLRIHNRYCWRDTVYGNITAKTDGEYLILSFLEKPVAESFDGKESKIFLRGVEKSAVKKIRLDFENCDDFTVYQEEIKDIRLTFKDELVCGHNLCRELQSGFIELAVDESISHREINIYNLRDNKRFKLKHFEERLLDKHGDGWFCLEKDVFGKIRLGGHDICSFDIYYNLGYGEIRRECVEIEDIDYLEEIERLKKFRKKGDPFDKDYYFCTGGYAEKTESGTLLLTFGDAAKKIKEKYRSNMVDST
jgi:hypothetical protein